MQHCRALQLQPTELSPAEGRHGACYLQDLIHDFLHDLTLSFRIAGAEKQEEIQVRKEDTERAQGEGGFVLSWLCLGAPKTWGGAEGGTEGGLGGVALCWCWECTAPKHRMQRWSPGGAQLLTKHPGMPAASQTNGATESSGLKALTAVSHKLG